MTDLKILYYFLYLPLKCCFQVMLGSVFIFGLILSIAYSLTLDSILNHEILTANYSDIESIIEWKPTDNTKIYDAKGELISEQFNEYHLYTPYEEIPPKMIEAIMAIEDRKFWSHPGIDFYGILRAATTLIHQGGGKYTQGASTITQQVVKNLLLTKDKTIERKLREIVLSLYLETVVSKEKIMEIYCNQMFLGFGSYGVSAAAKRYFDKDLKELEVHEMALIAGLFQLPGKYNPHKNPEAARARQLDVLFAMKDAGYLNQNNYLSYKKKELKYQEYSSQTKLAAPYFVDYIVEKATDILSEKKIPLKDSGLKIYTTLDLELQKMAESTIEQSQDLYKFMSHHMIRDNQELNEENEEGHLVEASLLVLDRRTGAIVSMVGGRDYEDSQFNRTFQSLRAPGSLFKPVTYSLALKRGKNWNDLYFISPITIGNYRPRTEDAKLFTETTLLEAFYRSVNSPAVSLGNELGMHSILRHANKLGIKTELKDEAATLLGSSEVTMFDMARVYGSFANKGKSFSPYSIAKIEDSSGKILFEQDNKAKEQRVLDIKTSELIIEGMKQVLRRGTGYKISHLSGMAAGKTGTSNRSRDNWFAGFTNDLVVISWMGNDNQNSFSGAVSASNTAAPLWGRFVSKSVKKLKTSYLEKPRYLRSAKINRKYGHIDPTGMRMYFHPNRLPRKQESDLMRVNNGEKIRITLNDF